MKKISKIIRGSYALALSAFLLGCSAKGQVEKKYNAIPQVPVTKLVSVDTVLHEDYVADVQALRHVEIRARVDGFLERVYVDEGQEVKKGQPLFRVSAEEYQAALAKTKAHLNNVVAKALGAELEVKRVKLLVEKDVVSPSELELAKAKLKAARAEVEEAQSAVKNASTMLSYTYIRAPFSGVLDRIPLKQGSLIEEGSLLTTLSDLKGAYAYFNVSEREYLAFQKLQKSSSSNRSSKVKLVLADGTLYPHTGEIETMEGTFEKGTGSIAFRARFPNPEKLLKHHSTGKVRLFNEVEDALIVPQKATFEIQDKNFVYVVDSDNRVRMTSFVPKARFSDFYIVGSGLQQGEQVVYEGARGLRDRAVIQPEVVPADSLLASASPGANS